MYIYFYISNNMNGVNMKYKMKKIIKDESENESNDIIFIPERLINASYDKEEAKEIWIFDDDYLTNYNEK